MSETGKGAPLRARRRHSWWCMAWTGRRATGGRTSKSNRATSGPYRRSIDLSVRFFPFREVTPSSTDSPRSSPWSVRTVPVGPGPSPLIKELKGYCCSNLGGTLYPDLLISSSGAGFLFRRGRFRSVLADRARAFPSTGIHRGTHGRSILAAAT